MRTRPPDELAADRTAEEALAYLRPGCTASWSTAPQPWWMFWAAPRGVDCWCEVHEQLLHQCTGQPAMRQTTYY